MAYSWVILSLNKELVYPTQRIAYHR
jgi:hypothetical protein